MLLQFSLTVALSAVSLVSAQDPITITGFSISEGSAVPLRQNINELQSAGGAQWDLYLRALAEMQSQDSADPLSFFQVAGIHGKPYIEWNNSGKMNSDGWQGYCPHGERLFLTWHRPYVVLYEQILVATAQRIAAEYPQRYRSQYVAAARNLRAPFWDWGSDDIPNAVVPSKMTVNIPSGNGIKATQIDNPLSTFKFPAAALNGTYGSFDSRNRSRISRCPSPDSFPDSANQLLADRPYKSWVYDAFTHTNTFDEFSSTGNGGTSLEQIHNAIHWDGACGGQFLAADFSAFDPLFMLHHCNVDRLWAYWQAMKPDQVMFNQSYSGGARWSTPRGTTITPKSPLVPFFADSENFHTSESVESIQTFGYAYEGLEYWRKSETQMQQDATRLINRLYSDTETMARRETRRSDSSTRFFARVKLDVTEVERPCSVNLYLNGKKVGGQVVMQQPTCGTVHGEFSLDSAVDSTEIFGYPVDSVVDTIMANLQVEILKHDGTNIPIEGVPSLKIELEDVHFTPPTSECELPIYENARRRATTPVQKASSPCGCKDSSADNTYSVKGHFGKDKDRHHHVVGGVHVKVEYGIGK
ncbi:tyrosinase [Ilyonectria robusta]|uniref:tyrosinase n=1 Tax=Ilyonectria robusta TaxID=1079257 RepID=UPI001E8DEC2E|nr:tyrosinase [Ilyonectria robusta]KAH8722111.1 tyrosinase [Ilyonectria robusta]